jgi:hypothetical protein
MHGPYCPTLNPCALFTMSESLPLLIETPPGRYRHYKGGLYEVVGTARHSETLEPMTLYRALYGEHGLWVRPAAMFGEEITSKASASPVLPAFQTNSSTPPASNGQFQLCFQE